MGARHEPGQPGVDRTVADRLEGIRTRGDAGSEGQCRDHLPDRESGPDGRPHGRQYHRRAGHDADGQRVSTDAGRRAPDYPGNRRRHRGVEHSVRHQSGQRRDGHHRDEPAGVPEFGPGVESDGISHRQDRGKTGGRLYPRRDYQRHYRRDQGVVRADHRLCRGEDPAVRLPEVQRGRSDADHADEIGGRGHGDRPDVQGIVAEGHPVARTGSERTGLAPRVGLRDPGGIRPAGRPGETPPASAHAGSRTDLAPRGCDPARDVQRGVVRAHENRLLVSGADAGDRSLRGRAGRHGERGARHDRGCGPLGRQGAGFLRRPSRAADRGIRRSRPHAADRSRRRRAIGDL